MKSFKSNIVHCVLALETSGSSCSVAIRRGGRTLYAAIFFLDQSHAKVLATLVQKAIKVSQISWEEIDAVAVGSGPGSYTGLRIGVSLTKGICFGQSKPLIAVSTMENLAHQAFKKNNNVELVLVTLDARRSEVYAAILNRKMEYLFPTQALVLGDINLMSIIEDTIAILVGDGSEKTIDFYAHPPNWKLDSQLSPSAVAVAERADMKLESGKFEDLVHFEPDYIKPVFVTVAK